LSADVQAVRAASTVAPTTGQTGWILCNCNVESVIAGWQMRRRNCRAARRRSIAESGDQFSAVLDCLLDGSVPVMSNQVQVSLLDPRARRIALCRPQSPAVKNRSAGGLAGGYGNADLPGRADRAAIPALDCHSPARLHRAGQSTDRGKIGHTDLGNGSGGAQARQFLRRILPARQ